MINSNWTRWIYASTSKYFKAIADSYPIPFFLEGLERDTNEQTKWIEFKLNGPIIEEISHGVFKIIIDINILWSVNLEKDDFHEPYRIIGLLTEAMENICVYKYGDDDSYLGTLQLNGSVRVQNFGQTKSNLQIVQGFVEQEYLMFLME